MSSDQQELAALIKVQFDLTPQTVISHSYRQTGEEEYSEAPVTLGEYVAEVIAKELAAEIKKDLRDRGGYDYRSAAETAVEVYARERVEQAVQRYTQPTDTFGTPKGEAKTIAELIDDKITAWFTTRRDSFSSSNNLDKILGEAVDRQLKSEMSTAVKDAKAKVLAALTGEAEALLSTALADIAAKAVQR